MVQGDSFFKYVEAKRICHVLILISEFRQHLDSFILSLFRYLSQELRNRFDHFAEVVVPNLINLLANSAKIMATSGNTALVFIIKVSS